MCKHNIFDLFRTEKDNELMCEKCKQTITCTDLEILLFNFVIEQNNKIDELKSDVRQLECPERGYH